MPAYRSFIPYRLAAAFLLVPYAAADTVTFDFDGSVRTRYETLDRPVRRGAAGADRLFVSQILLHGRVIGPSLFGGVELADSRATLDDAGTPLGTDDVNTLELLRAYIGLRRCDVFQAGANSISAADD